MPWARPDQPLQRLSKIAYGFFAKALLPSKFYRDQKLTACLLGLSSLRCQPRDFCPEARRVRSNDRKAALCDEANRPSDRLLRDSCQQRKIRTRTPLASRTPTTLALIASDNSDSLSNSRAKANSTGERSADRGLPSPTLRGADAVCL